MLNKRVSLSMHHAIIHLNIPNNLIKILESFNFELFPTTVKYDNIIVFIANSSSANFFIQDDDSKQEYIVPKELILFRFFIELEDLLMKKLLRINKSAIAIHGGGILYKNKAVLVLQNKGAGKSTLIAKLSQNSKYKYLADDLLIINRNYVRGISLPIRLRCLQIDGLNLKNRCNISGMDFDNNNRYFYMPNIEVEKAKVPISTILIPHYNTHGNNVIIESKGNEKAKDIINQIKKYHTVEGIYKNVSILAKHVRIFHLYYKNFANLESLPMYNEIL